MTTNTTDPLHWTHHVLRLHEANFGDQHTKLARQEVEALKRESEIANTQLDAWHLVFGTTQLSHAQARLEWAEKRLERAQSQLTAAREEIEALKRGPGWGLIEQTAKELDELRSENRKLRVQRDNLKEELDRLNTVASEVPDPCCLSDGHNHKTRVEECICSLKFQRTELQKCVQVCRDESIKFAKEAGELKAQVDALTHSEADAMATIKSMGVIVEDLKAQLKAEREENEKIHKQLLEAIEAWSILKQSTLRTQPSEQLTFQQEVGRWAIAKFTKGTKESTIEHLRREVEELAQSQEPVEAADCYLLLLHLAERSGFDLEAEAKRKFEINKGRTWGEPDAQGVQEHIRHQQSEPSYHGHKAHKEVRERGEKMAEAVKQQHTCELPTNGYVSCTTCIHKDDFYPCEKCHKFSDWQPRPAQQPSEQQKD